MDPYWNRLGFDQLEYPFAVPPKPGMIDWQHEFADVVNRVRFKTFGGE